ANERGGNRPSPLQRSPEGRQSGTGRPLPVHRLHGAPFRGSDSPHAGGDDFGLAKRATAQGKACPANATRNSVPEFGPTLWALPLRSPTKPRSGSPGPLRVPTK